MPASAILISHEHRVGERRASGGLGYTVTNGTAYFANPYEEWWGIAGDMLGAATAVRSWLERSLTGTFVKILSSVVQQNGTKAALVFGFAPAFPGKQNRSGSITLRDAFWGENERINFIGDGGVAGERRQPTIAWGCMTGRSVPENLRRLPFFFVSQGPSSLFSGQRDEVTRVPLRAAAAGLAARIGAALAV